MKVLCIFLLLASAVYATDTTNDDDEFVAVTCNSVIKLRHTNSKFRLHSHSINYGSGSGQQSVTGISSSSDNNSYFLVRNAFATTGCRQGDPVPCGSAIRLQHLETKRYLHSHYHQSPLTGHQEVSCFGQDDGSDSGDNWVVECGTGIWNRDEPVKLKHQDTNMYLYTTAKDKFNQNNCPNCPIRGQLEISARSRSDNNAVWATDEGIFFGTESADSN